MPQYLHTNSPNWSLYIFIENKLREFDKRSKQVKQVIIVLILKIYSLDCVLILWGEYWGWSLLGLMGLLNSYDVTMLACLARFTAWVPRESWDKSKIREMKGEGRADLQVRCSERACLHGGGALHFIPGRWGNPLRWVNLPVHIIPHCNLITFAW